MTNEQKIREIYPLIPKTDKTRGLDTLFYLVDGKKFYIFNWVRNLNPQKIDQIMRDADFRLTTPFVKIKLIYN